MGGNSSLEEFEKFSGDFRFVVLHHRLPAHSSRLSHWDLLLSPPLTQEEGLLTFEIGQSPDSWESLSTIRLPNHRIHYLTYEGPISKGRGHVRRVMAGQVQWNHFSTDRLCFLLLPTDANQPRMLVEKTRLSEGGWTMSVEKINSSSVSPRR